MAKRSLKLILQGLLPADLHACKRLDIDGANQTSSGNSTSQISRLVTSIRTAKGGRPGLVADGRLSRTPEELKQLNQSIYDGQQ